MTRLSYLRSMFATCMLFQVIYVACVGLWLAYPQLGGHALLVAILPGFELLTLASFVYGLILTGLYGWAVAIVFVFFYNLWPAVEAAIATRRRAGYKRHSGATSR